jgi:TPR repeat protein
MTAGTKEDARAHAHTHQKRKCVTIPHHLAKRNTAPLNSSPTPPFPLHDLLPFTFLSQSGGDPPRPPAPRLHNTKEQRMTCPRFFTFVVALALFALPAHAPAPAPVPPVGQSVSASAEGARRCTGDTLRVHVESLAVGRCRGPVPLPPPPLPSPSSPTTGPHAPPRACWLEAELAEPSPPHRPTRRFLVDWLSVPLHANPPFDQSLLRCAAADAARLCDVRALSMRRLNGSAVEVVFDTETDLPDVRDAAALRRLFHFEGAAGGWTSDAEAPLHGAWVAPSVLHIRHPDEVEEGDAGTRGASPDLVLVLLRGAVAAPLLRSRPGHDDGSSEGAEGGAGDRAAAPGAIVLRSGTEGPVSRLRHPASLVRILAPAGVTLRLCAWAHGGADSGTDSGLNHTAPCRRRLASAAAEDGEPNLAVSTDVCPCEEVVASAHVDVVACEDDPDRGGVVELPPPAEGSRAGLPRRRPPPLLPRNSPGPAAHAASPSDTSPLTPSPVPVVQPPAPTFSLAGVAGVGAKGMRIPHGSLPPGAQEGGSWSLSFWMWMWADAGEDATTAVGRGKQGGDDESDPRTRASPDPDGSTPHTTAPFPLAHRVLFFKGPGGSDQSRTPSAWLAPDARRLVLRASSSGNADVGGESVGPPLPVREWVHLAFTFSNASAERYAQELDAWRAQKADRGRCQDEDGAAGAAPGVVDCPPPPAPPASTFAYRLFVNGQLDTEITYNWPALIVPNRGPLHIGASPDFAGVTGLVARLRLWDGALAPSDVARLHADDSTWFQPGGKRLGPISSSAAQDEDDGRATAPGAALDPAEAHLLRGIVAASRVVGAWGPWYWPRGALAHADAAERARLLMRSARTRPACADVEGDIDDNIDGWRGPATTGPRRGRRGATTPTCLADPESPACEAELTRGRRRREASRAAGGLLDDEEGEEEEEYIGDDDEGGAASCPSQAEAQAWAWTLEFLGAGQQQARLGEDGVPAATVSDMGSGAQFQTSSSISCANVEYGADWHEDTNAGLMHARTVLGDCSAAFVGSEAPPPPSPASARRDNDAGSPSPAATTLREILLGPDGGLRQREADNNPGDGALSDSSSHTSSPSSSFYRFSPSTPGRSGGRSTAGGGGYFSTYLGALSLVESGAAGGTGCPTSSRLLGQARLQPGRDTCPSELRRLGRALARHSVLDPRSNEDPLTTILGTLLRPIAALGRLLGSAVAGLRSLAAAQRSEGQGAASPAASAREAETAAAAAAAEAEAAAAAAALQSSRAGVGLRRDTVAGRHLLAAAAMRGDAGALYEWGVAIMVGAGSGLGESAPVPSAHDAAFGLGLVHLAASAGNPTAWYFLSRRYATGEGGLSSIPAYADALLVGADGERRGLSADEEDEEDISRRGARRLAEAVQDAQTTMRDHYHHHNRRRRRNSPHHHTSRRRGLHGVALLERYFSFTSTGVPRDVELAAWYAEWAADVSEAAFHGPAGRPHHEFERLSMDAADSGAVEESQRGDEDERIAYQRLRADRGDVDAMLAMAGLLYWGARGVPRDHAAAYAYYARAAEAGNADALVRAAELCLKGEGTPKNFTAALAYYERAGAMNDTRALNGLGYAYYFGQHGVEQNATLAFAHFARAAAQRTDSDSLFNAGRCLQTGVGTSRNLTAARELYEDCVRMGHFDCVQSMGRMYAHGALPAPRGRPRRAPVQRRTGRGGDTAAAAVAANTTTSSSSWQGTAAGQESTRGDAAGREQGSSSTAQSGPHGGGAVTASTASTADGDGAAAPDPDLSLVDAFVADDADDDDDESNVETLRRDAPRALEHFAATSALGPWAHLVRRGFERYLARDYDGALLHYLHAYLLGYEVGAANAAYLLQRKLAAWGAVAGGQRTTDEADGNEAPDAPRLRLARLLYHYSYARGGKDSILPLAEHALRGTGGMATDVHTAVALFARASASGSAQASFALGEVYEGGAWGPAGGIPPDQRRAERYYRRVLDLTPAGPAHAPIYIALARMRARGWVDDALARWTGTGIDGWWASGWGGSPVASASAASDAVGSSSYWGDVARLKGSLGLRMFEWLLGDPSPNAAHESGGGEEGGDGGKASPIWHVTGVPGLTAAGAAGALGAGLLVVWALLVRRGRMRAAARRGRRGTPTQGMGTEAQPTTTAAGARTEAVGEGESGVGAAAT